MLGGPIQVDRYVLHNMPIPSSSSYPPQPLTAGSSSCGESTPGCRSRPYASSLNSDVGAPDSVVDPAALDGAVAVVPVAPGTVVDKPLYQLICFWPASGMLDPLARPYNRTNSTDRKTEIRFHRHTCSAAARVLNATTTSPFSSVSTASTWPPASYQSRTAWTLSLSTSLMSNFLGRLSSFMLARAAPPRAPPR